MATMLLLGLAATMLGQTSSGVPARRLEHLKTGANVCRWFRFPIETTDRYYESYISDDEMTFMRKMGLRHVRLCLAPQNVMDPATGEPKEHEWPYVERAVDRFLRHGLAVVVDMHNENRKDEADPAWQEHFRTFWGTVAKRLSRFDTDRVFFEIVNEPVFSGKEAEWGPIQLRLASTIRRNAPSNTLVATGAYWGGIYGLQKIEPLPDRNVVYSFHCYDPFAFTHQGATWSSDNVKPLRGVPYPSSPEAVAPLLPSLPKDAQDLLTQYGNERWGRRKMEENFRQAIDWGKKYRAPLYCGEFGVFPVYAKPEHRANWFRDFGGVLSENKVGWASWGWDEGFGFNRRIENGKIVVDEVVVKALGLKMP